MPPPPEILRRKQLRISPRRWGADDEYFQHGVGSLPDPGRARILRRVKTQMKTGYPCRGPDPIRDVVKKRGQA